MRHPAPYDYYVFLGASLGRADKETGFNSTFPLVYLHVVLNLDKDFSYVYWIRCFFVCLCKNNMVSWKSGCFEVWKVMYRTNMRDWYGKSVSFPYGNFWRKPVIVSCHQIKLWLVPRRPRNEVNRTKVTATEVFKNGPNLFENFSRAGFWSAVYFASPGLSTLGLRWWMWHSTVECWKLLLSYFLTLLSKCDLKLAMETLLDKRNGTLC